MSNPCMFCEIVEFRAPADRIHDTPDTSAFVPLNPVTPGHVLIVPTRHVRDAAEDPEVTARTMADAAKLAGLYGVPFNLITSAGADATQTVFHLHIHYVPRRPGDGLALPWTGQHEALTSR